MLSRFSKYVKYLMPLALCLQMLSLPLYADEDDEDEHGDRSQHEIDVNTRDFASMREFLRTKRNIDIMEKFAHLTFSGDVRFEWRHMTETMNGVNLREHKHNDFDIEANFWTKYDTDRSWMTMQLQYDNSAGVDDNCCCCDAKGREKGCKDGGCDEADEETKELAKKAGSSTGRRFHGSGFCDNICLKRAYLGYRFYEGPCGDLDMELGRRPLYDVFESDIEFNSRFDGVVFEAGKKFEWADRLYVKLAGLIVDEKVNHFAFVTEIGLLGLHNWDLKYSFIDWGKKGRDRCKEHNPHGFQYKNSQFIATYNVDPKLLCRPLEVFGAVLYNHAADKAALNRHCKGGAWGWYAGFTLGEVDKENDWSIECEYQWVGKNAIAYDDENGIGVGDTLADFCGGPGPSTGYHGFYIDTLYAITDNLTVETIIEVSRSLGGFSIPGYRESDDSDDSDDSDSSGRYSKFARSSSEGSSGSGNSKCSKIHNLSRRHHFSKLEVELAYAF